MTNEETIKGKWTEFKGEILSQWGKMTDDELDTTKGNLVSIAGLIQQKYGSKKEEVQEGLNNLIAKFSEKTEEIKNNLRNDSSNRR